MLIIGIDIGGMSIKGGVVDENGAIVYRAVRETRTATALDGSLIIADVAELLAKLLAGAGGAGKVKGIGIGIPGSIDSKRGVIVYSNNIKLLDVHIVEELQKIYKTLPVYIANDANAAALGEVKFGSAKNYKNVVFVTIGTGIGTGLVLDGKLFEGNCSAGAEGGHTVIAMGGEPCNCGRRGCLEAYASATALMRQTKAAMERCPDSIMHELSKTRGKVSGRTAFEAAAKGDEAGLSVVKRYLGYVGEGLINFANIFRPDAILIGGGLSNESKYPMFEALQEYMDEYCFGIKNGNPRVLVKKAALGNDAGILGAASLVP